MDSLILQNQIRNNAEELQHYLKDLSIWNKEMKRKEETLNDIPSYSKEIPPVRNKRRKMKKSQENSNKEKSKRISGLDYSSWEKYDDEKACDDSPPSDTEMEVPPQVEHRLREEASYEKEKGNQFVKSQQWDDAIKCYTRAIRCYPNDAIFYANRALCFLKTKDFRAAETDCTSALQLDSTYVKAYHRRATARMELNQLQEAAADLHRVLELEPTNNTSRLELEKLEKKVVKPAAQEPKSKIFLDAIPGTSGQSQVKNLPTKDVKCLTNQGTARKNKIEIVSTDETGNHTTDQQSFHTTVVQPVKKPPHLRSKKRLRRIEIEDFDPSLISDVADINRIDAVEPLVKQNPVSENVQSGQNVGNKSSSDENLALPVPTPTHFLAEGVKATGSVNLQTEVPPAPVSSVQFLVGWNKVKGNPKLMYLYLKQIRGPDLPKLFQDSLESNIISSILFTLASEFVKEGTPIFSYLLGLSNVRRFSSLSLFLSKEEKHRVCKLLDHCVSCGECSNSEAAMLRGKYEL